MITVLGRSGSSLHPIQIDKGENTENRRDKKYIAAGEISGAQRAVVSFWRKRSVADSAPICGLIMTGLVVCRSHAGGGGDTQPLKSSSQTAPSPSAPPQTQSVVSAGSPS